MKRSLLAQDPRRAPIGAGSLLRAGSLFRGTPSKSRRLPIHHGVCFFAHAFLVTVFRPHNPRAKLASPDPGGINPHSLKRTTGARLSSTGVFVESRGATQQKKL